MKEQLKKLFEQCCIEFDDPIEIVTAFMGMSFTCILTSVSADTLSTLPMGTLLTELSRRTERMMKNTKTYNPSNTEVRDE